MEIRQTCQQIINRLFPRNNSMKVKNLNEYLVAMGMELNFYPCHDWSSRRNYRVGKVRERMLNGLRKMRQRV